MKRCPQCDAEYDNHVEYCFVDGAELVLQSDGSGSGPRVGPTPLPPPPPDPGASAQRMRSLALVLGVVAVVALIAVIAVAIALLGGPTDPEGSRTAGASDVVVPATPSTADPPDFGAPEIALRSEPSGAEVWEGKDRLCSATPCRVEYPSYGPASRELRFELEGYEPRTIVIDKSRESWSVALETAGRRRSPSPAPVAPPSRLDQDLPGLINER